MEILPSLFNSNILKLQDEIDFMERNNVNIIHIDLMDGTFVPNISFGPDQIRTIKKYTKMNLDVHMMIQNPEKMIKEIADAGADMISFHYESTAHPHEVIRRIKSFDIKAGVAISPATSPQVLEYILDDIDYVLLMSINPGFWNQDFIDSVYKKIAATKKLIDDKDVLIEIDGRMNVERIKEASKAGADLFVVGSNLFNGDKETNLRELQKVED